MFLGLGVHYVHILRVRMELFQQRALIAIATGTRE